MKAKNEHVTIRIPAKLKNMLKSLAAQRGKYIYELIAEMTLKEIGAL